MRQIVNFLVGFTRALEQIKTNTALSLKVYVDCAERRWFVFFLGIFSPFGGRLGRRKILMRPTQFAAKKLYRSPIFAHEKSGAEAPP